jgi:hypothetical protein
MDSFSRRHEDPEDIEYGEDWLNDDLVDPDDLPVPSGEWKDIAEYLEQNEKKRKQKRRRKERHDKYRDRDY